MPLIEDDKKISDMANKIQELEKFSENQGLDLSGEIRKLQQKLEEMKNEMLTNLTPWDKLTLARMMERPTSLDYIERIFDSFIELHGDRQFRDDECIVGGLAVLAGKPVTVIAQQKGRDTKENILRNFGMPHPEGYRKALRLMKQAEKFGRPVICLVDTPGAFPGIGAEERGQGEAIAQNLFQMSILKVPVISVLIGEGGSGGALAMAVADRVWMLEHAIYSILTPEGFASILWKDSSRAKEAADIMKITAQDLMNFGIIDKIIEEPLGGAHKDVEGIASNLKNELIKEINNLCNIDVNELLNARYNKFRNIGAFSEN